MKNFKEISILLAVSLMVLSACTPQMDNDSETSNADDTQNEAVMEPVQLPVEDVETEGSGNEISDTSIIGTPWTWARFDDTADMNNIVVEHPSLYTLLLSEDGTYTLKADCNMASGSYTLDGSSITFQAGPTTLAECGPESLYNTYLARMGAVATFVMDGENLVLNMWADGGNLVFGPAE